jgi:hypothetical protein
MELYRILGRLVHFVSENLLSQVAFDFEEMP